MQQTVDVKVQYRADPGRVWAILTDHEGMPHWMGFSAVHLRPEGSPDRNGVGAVRVMHGPGLTLREEIISWDPPHAYEYKLVSKAPIRDHKGRVEVTGGDGHSTARWHIVFKPKIPGTGLLLRLFLQRQLGGALENARKLIER